MNKKAFHLVFMAGMQQLQIFTNMDYIAVHLNIRISKVKYAQRELLGFSEEDIEMIERFVIKAIAEGSL